MIFLMNKKTKKFYDKLPKYIETQYGKDYSRKYLVDFIINKLMYGVGIDDYFDLGFHKKNHLEKRKFVTKRHEAKIWQKLNATEDNKWLNQKNLFNTKFDKYVFREWLYVRNAEYDEFEKFCKKHPVFIVKPNDLFSGEGVEKIEIKENSELKEIYEKCCAENLIAEEVLTQEASIERIHPSSVNTVKITTIWYGNDIKVIGTACRFGTGDSVADNMDTGGLYAPIDLNTGIISGRAMNKNNNKYIKHPDTEVEITGFQFPMWNELVNKAIELAKILPNVKLIGWDLCITADKKIAVIEGNERPDLITMQKGDEWGRKNLYEQAYLKSTRK